MAKHDPEIQGKVGQPTIDSLHAWAKEHRPDLLELEYLKGRGFVAAKKKRKK